MSALHQALAAFGKPITSYLVGGYYNAGTYSFVVPGGVTTISMLCLGAGGGGCAVGGGGGAGACVYSNNVAVTPGETLTIEVGAGGAGGTTTAYTAGSAGGASSIKRGGTTLVQANAGGGGTDTAGGSGAASGTGSVINAGGAGGRDEVGNYGGFGGNSGNPATYGTVLSPSWAPTIYHGGGRGGGMAFTETGWTQAAQPAESPTRHGSYPGLYESGNGGGGGAWGDAGQTLVGNGGWGANGFVALIWGGRTFSASDTF